ncbi:MAG TPA: Fe-S oxidoreductase, partial [Cyclobacteriaceae bacterium]|nr:Fe-S oxidoreductase [Cyclobacteriaceae bacterium]
MMVQQIAFVLVLITAIYFIRKRILLIRSAIRLGKESETGGNKTDRLKNMLLVAFGQKKMFKKIIPAILHLFIYVGFLVINLEVMEFVVDGIAGTHRIFAPWLGSFYSVLMNVFEFLAVAVLLACVFFLIRRNILKVPRFWSAEMTNWPRMDANLILVTEIVLMTAILTMNAADQVLQTRDSHYVATGSLFFSSFLVPIFQNTSTSVLIVIERFAWWFH